MTTTTMTRMTRTTASSGQIDKVMERDRISKKVRDIFTEYIASVKVREEHDIENDLGLDSLDRTEILLKVENEFGISVNTAEENEFYDLDTVGDVVDFLEKRLEKEGISRKLEGMG